MPINWGSQTPIQPPSVIAQLPAQAPNNQANSFAGGIMEGILQGQQVKSNALQIKQQEQQAADLEQLRNTRTPDQYRDALISQGNMEKVLQYDTNQVQYQSALLQNKASAADLTVKQRAVTKDNLAISAHLVTQVINEPDPSKRKQLYETGARQLNRQIPGLNLDPTYSEDSIAGLANSIQAIQTDFSSQATESVKTFQQLMNIKDSLVAQKQQAQKDRRPTQDIEDKIKLVQSKLEKEAGQQDKEYAPSDTRKRIDELNEARRKAGQAPLTPEEETTELQKGLKSASESKGTIGPTTAAQGRADEDELKAITKRKTDRAAFQYDAQKALESVRKNPSIAQGPITGWLSSLTPDGQKMIADQTKIMLTYKNVQNMGSQGFTDKDREIVAAANGNFKTYKGTAEELLQDIIKFQDHQERYDWLQENNIKKKLIDEGQDAQYKAWLEQNPEPMVVVQDESGNTGEVPVSQVAKLRKDHPKAKVID